MHPRMHKDGLHCCNTKCKHVASIKTTKENSKDVAKLAEDSHGETNNEIAGVAPEIT